MLNGHVKEPVLFQYASVIPYGERVTDWIAEPDHFSKLSDCEVVSIVGRNGNLRNLNLTATLIFENMRENRTGREILEVLFRYFAQSRETARRITREYVEFVDEMEELGFITKFE